MKHLKPLTSLRFFAAFVVVLCHVRYSHVNQLSPWAWNFSKNGFVGVNLFFVLSGFVIAYNYGEKFLEKTTTFGKFMVARFARIWPAFVAALILAFPVYVLSDKAVLAKMPVLLPIHLLLIHNWFPNLGYLWLSPSWTIGTEWGFYLMFPLFAAAVFKLRERGLWTLLIVAGLLAFVAPYLYHSGLLSGAHGNLASGDDVGGDFWGRALRWYSIFRLPEFVVGVCVCRLFMLQDSAQRDRWARFMGPIALASLVFVAWVMASDALPMMYIDQAVLTLPFAVLIWFLAYDKGLVAKWMAIPSLVLLGEASYSLYLVHIIVKQVMFRFAGHFFHVPADSIALTLFVIVAAVVASIVMFIFVEKPSRKWIVGRFGGKPNPAPAPIPESVEQDPVPVSAAP